MQRSVSISSVSSSWVFALAMAGLGTSCLSSGGGGGGNDSNGPGPSNGQPNAEACYSCGVEKCPNEAAACDGSPGCVTLRDCTLDCAPTDVACRTECSTAASSDANAILVGGNFLACATLNCQSECVGSPSPGPSPGPNPGPSPGPGPSSGPGPVSGQGLCQQLNDWATACNVSTQGQIPDCSALDAAGECMANCILGASCAEFQAASSATQNQLTNCMAACISGPSPSVPSAPTPSSPQPTGLAGEGGYVVAGSWQGFAWTGTDSTSSSTIQPADFSALVGGSLCATGTVAGTSDYSAVAMIGINLNQPNLDPAPEPATWTPPPSSLGVGYQITNFGGSPLRLQIQAPGGDTNANARFCAEIFEAGTVSWSRFNTECWEGGSGTNYNGTTPLESIMVLVPGGLSATPFDFCIQSLSPQ